MMTNGRSARSASLFVGAPWIVQIDKPMSVMLVQPLLQRHRFLVPQFARDQPLELRAQSCRFCGQGWRSDLEPLAVQLAAASDRVV